MAQTPMPDETTFLSTGVVARALGLESTAIRSMIESGTLPEPQWMSMGRRVERVYSIEWLVLASEQLNLRLLPGFERFTEMRSGVRFALRFNQELWTIEEVARKLEALQDLWAACASVVSDDEAARPPALNLTRLSAGSPLDILAWLQANWPGVTLGVGLFVWLLKNPDKVGEALPRLISAWHGGRADAADNRVRSLLARHRAKKFESLSSEALDRLAAVPDETALLGDQIPRLENFPARDHLTVERPSDPREEIKPKELSASGNGTGGENAGGENAGDENAGEDKLGEE